jgi:hypothetical protein
VRLGQGCPIIQVVALSSPAAARRWGTWRWLVVVSSAKQKQQLHHQQLTNGSTILKNVYVSRILGLILTYLQYFWIYFSEYI